MDQPDRRQFLKAGAVALGAPAALGLAQAAAQPAAKPPFLQMTETPAVTAILAGYLVDARYEDLPASVRHEGVRTLLNWVGVAVGGSHHETVDRAVAALAPFSGTPQATLLGRSERFDIMKAAFVNGVSSHVHDFDDTHLKTIIHPGAPVISALLALSEYQPVSGKEFLNALVLGVETACRIGNAVYPDHYDAGWHITGTAGVFGAAACAGKVLGLNQQQMVWALGLAASQPVGLRESFGSMNKSFNPGRAAENGLFAALLAARNFTSSNGMIEARRGWAQTISTRQDYREITEGLGTRYEAALNTYKPFACGIVTHPAIDAAIRLRNQFHLVPDEIDQISLRVNPLVQELTGKTTPRMGLEGKFSIYHVVAIAFIDGKAGQKQFSDAAVRSPVAQALRSRIHIQVDPAITPEQVDMVVRLKDGRELHKFIGRAVGSLEVPMTDAQLEDKFLDQADGVLSVIQAQRLMAACWGVEELLQAAQIAQAAAATT